MKYPAFGTKLLRGAVEIAQVRTINGMNLSVDTVDVTSHDSPDGWEEIIPTILRSGELSLEILYDPNDATHKLAAGGLLNDFVSKTSQAFTLTFPTSPVVNWTFTAYVTGFEPTMPVDGELAASVTLKPTGKPTLA